MTKIRVYSVRRLRRPDLSNRQLLVIGLAVMLFTCSATVLVFWPPAQPAAYKYFRTVSPDGVVLHAVRTSPRHVTLKAIDRNVTETGLYGVNGGFFWNGDLLSIAVMADRPLKGASGDYGSGWYNVDNAKGTLVWDDEAGRFSVQVAIEAGELQVTDRSRFWAQGGISMRLGDDAGWYAAAAAEGLPAMDEGRMRTAALYDRDGNLWLIVTPTPCTGERFRAAIKAAFAGSGLVDGVFLDGDGSSQLRVREALLPGDRREVYQMIALTK